jgi:hypothetical protein
MEIQLIYIKTLPSPINKYFFFISLFLLLFLLNWEIHPCLVLTIVSSSIGSSSRKRVSEKKIIRTFKDRRETACIIIEFEGLIRERSENRHCSNAYACAHSVYGRWIVTTLRFFQPTLRYLIKTIKKLGVIIWRHVRCKCRRRIPTDRVSASSSTSNSSIYSSLALQLVNMRKDDEANDNNEPII